MLTRVGAFFESLFLRDRILMASVALSLGFNALIWAVIALNLEVIHVPGQEYIILHYRLFYGPDFTSNWQFIFIPPIVGLVFAIANHALARFAYNRVRVIAHCLGAASVLTNALLLAGTYLIIRVNIF